LYICTDSYANAVHELKRLAVKGLAVGEGSFGDLSPLVPSMRPQYYSRACVSRVDELLLVNDASRRGDLDPGARTRCCLWQEFRNVNLRLAAAEAGAVDRIVPSSCENPGAHLHGRAHLTPQRAPHLLW
jgi:hypothetical protein